MAEKPEKRFRKANFTEKEVQILLEEVSLEHTILFSSHNQAVTQKRKNEIWKKICDNVNVCGVAKRTTQDCKDKWKGLKGAVLNRQREQRKTGGGPIPPPVPFEQLILTIIGRDSSLITGIAVEDTDTFTNREPAGNPGTSEEFPDSVSQQPAPSLESQDLGASTAGCSHWSSDSGRSTPLLLQTFSAIPDAAVVDASANYGDGSVVIVGVDNSMPLRSSTATGKKRDRRVSGKSVIAASAQEDLVDEWLRSEIDKNNDIQTHLALKNKKLELEIAKLESEKN